MNKKIIKKYMILYINHSVWYAAKGYYIYKSFDSGKNWQLDSELKDYKYSFIANCNRLLARLFRAEITNLLLLQNGSRLITAKKGIFLATKNDKIYKKVFHVERGNRPMNICEDNCGNLYFGEYFSNKERDEVHIYQSKDNGNTWDICYSFPKGTIRHIHGIFYDKFEQLVWFATGDFDGECIIGNTSDSFKNIKIFKQGGQKYRAVKLLFYQDFIIYGTDTEHEQNYIYKIDRNNGQEHIVSTLQGSVLSAASNGKISVIATAVEPSVVNQDNHSYIWISKNGSEWKQLLSAQKDKYSYKYFQYGSFKFPYGAVLENKIVFTGHALSGYDSNSIVCSINK